MKFTTDRSVSKIQDDILAPNIEYYNIQKQTYRLKEIKMKQPLICFHCDPAVRLEWKISYSYSWAATFLDIVY